MSIPACKMLWEADRTPGADDQSRQSLLQRLYTFAAGCTSTACLDQQL